jgi:hypothetical protein
MKTAKKTTTMKSKTAINKMFATMRSERNKKIRELRIANPKRPRWELCLEVDQQAELTNNWLQLAMLGINPDTATLEEIINGLALWHIFLLDTNHLTDDVLRSHIVTKILTEPTQMVPPNKDMHEFISLSGSRCENDFDVSDRDLHLPRPTKTKKQPA